MPQTTSRPYWILVLILLLAPAAAAASSAYVGAEPDARAWTDAGPVETPTAENEEAVRASTERALTALSDRVGPLSDDAALRVAFRAYYAFAGAHPDQLRNPYLFFVDYGLDNQTARGYVFDMETLAVVDGPFMVAHGRNSSRGRNAVPDRFSNRAGSNMSSLGLYLTQETYGFRGRSGGRAYRSVGLRLKGLSGPFNDAARRRGIVSHGAPYVTAGDAGRSQGCPAMEQHRARKLLPMIANGGLVFLYSPGDADWLRDDPWIGTAS